MYFYATLLDKGDRIAANKDEAMRYYKMASEKGNKEAKEFLASIA